MKNVTASTMFFLVVFAGFCALARPASAADRNIFGMQLFPVISYAPETRGALGIYGIGFQRLICDTPDCRPSSVKFMLMHTQNSQTVIQLNPEFITSNKEYIFSTSLGYVNFPTKYFGIGNNTLQSAEENYTEKTGNLQLSVQKQVTSTGRVGIRYNFWNMNLTDIGQNGSLATKLVPGSDGGKVNCAGLTFEYDTRDNVLSASRGAYHDIFVGGVDKTVGSDFSYVKYEVNLRKYIPVFQNHVLALRAKLDFNNGTLPFQLMPGVGGAYFLRGYYEGRFRDNNFIGCQAEYRFPVHKLLNLVVFGEAGEVAGRIEDFRADGVKPAAGIGTRFFLDKKEKVVVRTDYGIGVDSAGLYINIHEAF